MAPPPGFDIKAAHVAAQWPCERPLNCCRFDPSGEYVVVGGESATPERVKVADGKRTPLKDGHESWVFDVAFTKDGTRVVTAAGDGRLVWWDLTSEQPAKVTTVEAHRGWIRALAVSPDGSTLASGGNDGAVRLWSLADAKPIRELKAHKRDVYRVIFAHDGQTLVSGDLLGQIVASSVADGKDLGRFDAKPLHTYEGGQQVDFGGVRALAFSPDGAHLAAGGLHKASNPLGAVHEPLGLLFQASDRKLVRQWVGNGVTGGVFWSFRWLADGSLVGASGGGSGGLLLFFKPDGEKEIHRLAMPNILRDMDLAPDGLRLATAHHDRHLRIVRLAAKSG